MNADARKAKPSAAPPALVDGWIQNQPRNSRTAYLVAIDKRSGQLVGDHETKWPRNDMSRHGAADRIRPHETHGRYPTTPARGTNQPSTRPRREEAGKSAVTSGGRRRGRTPGG